MGVHIFICIHKKGLHKVLNFNLSKCMPVLVLFFFCRSFPQLRATFEEYGKLSEKDIEQVIKDEMSGDIERAMLTIGKFLLEVALFYLSDNTLSVISEDQLKNTGRA